MKNRRFVLASRPTGLPSLGDFRAETIPVPTAGPGQILVRNHLIGLNPSLRLRLSEDRTFAPPIALGGLIEATAVGTVGQSRHPDFQTGDWVFGNFGWQDWAVSDGSGVGRLQPGWARTAPLSILGSAGLTAYFGLLELGAPKSGETVVISSAAGSVGSIAGQIAGIVGARTVGIAGGSDKCRWLTEELGFDAAIDRKDPAGLEAALARTCPEGIDVLFDSVGNTVIDACLPHMRPFGRIAAIGQIGDYNADPSSRHGLVNTQPLITRRLTIRGLGVNDFAPRFPDARRALEGWLDQGLLKWRDDISDGFEALPASFIGLFTAGSFGRKIVRIAPDTPESGL